MSNKTFPLSYIEDVVMLMMTMLLLCHHYGEDGDNADYEYEAISGVFSELDSLNCAYIAFACHCQLSCQSSLFDDDDANC